MQHNDARLSYKDTAEHSESFLTKAHTTSATALYPPCLNCEGKDDHFMNYQFNIEFARSISSILFGLSSMQLKLYDLPDDVRKSIYYAIGHFGSYFTRQVFRYQYNVK